MTVVGAPSCDEQGVGSCGGVTLFVGRMEKVGKVAMGRLLAAEVTVALETSLRHVLTSPNRTVLSV